MSSRAKFSLGAPARLNRPATVEGRQVWDLAQAAQGQTRVSGLGEITGYDMTAVLAMAAARGVDRAAVAELLPHVEAARVAAAARHMRRKTDGG